LLVLCLMTTTAGQITLIRCRGVELQQFVQGYGSSLMKGGPQGALDGFQIGSSAVAPLGEDAAQQLIYFPRNFLMDCSSRFFS
jgi:hypothetical protein